MIDRFTRADFEAVLPANTTVTAPLGLIGGEYCYLITVRKGVFIYVRSSVGADGLAGETAKDSIRAWLSSGPRGEPLGSKNERWISRVNGWQDRLLATLRVLWRLGRQLKRCQCGAQLLALKVKKEGPNKGRWFSNCPACKQFGAWLETEAKPPIVATAP